MYVALKSCFKLNLHGGKHIIWSETKPQARRGQRKSMRVGRGEGGSTSNEVVSDIRLLRLKRPTDPYSSAPYRRASYIRDLMPPAVTHLSLSLSLSLSHSLSFFVYFCAMPRFAYFLLSSPPSLLPSPPSLLPSLSSFTSCTCRSIVRHFLCKLRCFHLLHFFHLYAALCSFLLFVLSPRLVIQSIV